MKILRIGDSHAKLNNLDEQEALVFFIEECAKDLEVDRIEFLGDLLHTHSIVRLEVLKFWSWALEYLSKSFEVVVLVGNHDISGDYSSYYSALNVFADLKLKNLTIIVHPTIVGKFGYISYRHKNDEFVQIANELYDKGARVLVCHQTFDGSKFESGMFAPDGIDPNLLKFDLVISGHIHAHQKFGKVIYPGTPRWDTDADVNQQKGIWMYTHDDCGNILSERFISSETCCKPILSFHYKEGDSVIPTWSEGSRVSVELEGTSTWIAQEKAKLKGSCNIKTKITDKKSKTNRNTGKDLEDFIKNLFVSTMDREGLVKYAKELGIL